MMDLTKMIEAIFGSENSNHKAERIHLDIDGGDKEFTMDSHREEMLDIGSMILQRTRASLVRITSYNGGNLKRVILFNVENGDWDIEVDEWEDDRQAETSLEITDPEHEGLWEAIRKYDLLFRKETRRGWTWTFTGTVSNIERFVKEYYFLNDPESAEEHLNDGGIIILN